MRSIERKIKQIIILDKVNEFGKFSLSTHHCVKSVQIRTRSQITKITRWVKQWNYLNLWGWWCLLARFIWSWLKLLILIFKCKQKLFFEIQEVCVFLLAGAEPIFLLAIIHKFIRSKLRKSNHSQIFFKTVLWKASQNSQEKTCDGFFSEVK